jgi:hypothetical protein
VAPVLMPELFPEGPDADRGPEFRSISPRTWIIRPRVDMSHRVDNGHTVPIGHTSHGREPVGHPKRRSHVKTVSETTYWETTYWETTYWETTYWSST